MISGIRRAWSLVGQHQRRRLSLVALYGIVIAGLDTVALLLIYALINLLNDQPVTGVSAWLVKSLGLRVGSHYHAALILLAITSILFVGRSVLSVLGLWLNITAANAAQVDLVSRLLVGHARSPQVVRLERNTSEMLRTVMSSVDQVVNGVLFSAVQLVANGAVAVAVAIGLMLSSPLVATAASIYFFLIALAWGRGVRSWLVERGTRIQQLYEERYRLVLQGMSAAKELQLRGRALFYAQTAVARTRGINEATRAAGVANGGLRYMLETALVVGAVLVVAVAGTTGGRASALPAVGLVLAGAFRLLPALNQILFLNNQVQFNAAATDFVAKELETFGVYATNSEDSDDDLCVPHRFTSELRLDGVTVRYPTRVEPALDDVSLVVKPGESIGIVGPTGSGKSTLLDVILGMLDPATGSVTLDGEPLDRVRTAWQRSIGYVPQEVYLVDDTLRVNVALGWPDDEVDDERVAGALTLAGLDDVVAALPDGRETVVGERGVRLSGGQRQRVGLARALYTRPSVLVLDEATSNLDHTTEQRIIETLAALRGGVTMIVVTHRIPSVRYCDRLVYVERGRIRAVGSFADVGAEVPELSESKAAVAVARAR